MSRNARLGLVLFAIYLALYGGFVFLNAFNPKAMEWTPLGGINLAILYGFALIIAALVMALLYGATAVDEAAPAPMLPGSAPASREGAAK